ncbi:MAG TPA: glycosyltransferase [Chloroflexota bacterium]|nr:glycosyltransferase [Chloroflexota bacterium]
MRVAWFTPFSHESAIGHFSEIVLRELRAEAEVTLFASDIAAARDARSDAFDLQVLWGKDPAAVAASIAGFECVVYNLGNHYEMHHRSYEVALRRPGLVILHDLVMHHMFAGRYLGKVQNFSGYLGELEYAHGDAGRRMGELILSGGAGALVWDSPTMLEYHMARSAVRGSVGVIVHSRYAQQAVAAVAAVPVVHFAFPTPSLDLSELPGASRPDDDRLRLLTFGMVNRNKMVEEVIRVIGSSRVLRDRVVYQIAGDSVRNVSYHERIVNAIRELQLESVVQLLGYQSDPALLQCLSGADVVINLRNPHFGEGSWSLLETSFAAKATVVWRHGFYDEFPDDTVAKVSSLDELKETLERLCLSDAERLQRGQLALAYARRTFVTADYVRRLVQFADQARYNAPALALADFAAARLQELGVTIGDVDLLDRVAQEVSDVSGVGRATGTRPYEPEEAAAR